MKKIVIAGAFALATLPAVISAATPNDAPKSGADHGCITSTGSSWNDSTQKCARPGEESTNGSGTNQARPPKTASGGELEMKSLQMAISQLSDADRAELTRMVKTYLDGKGVKLPTKDEVQTIKQENKEDRQAVKMENTTTRETARATAKANRESLKKRVQERRNTVMSGSVVQ